MVRVRDLALFCSGKGHGDVVMCRDKSKNKKLISEHKKHCNLDGRIHPVFKMACIFTVTAINVKAVYS